MQGYAPLLALTFILPRHLWQSISLQLEWVSPSAILLTSTSTLWLWGFWISKLEHFIEAVWVISTIAVSYCDDSSSSPRPQGSPPCAWD